MIRSKFAKAFVLTMCITVFSSAAVFAETGGGQSDAFQGQQTDSEIVAVTEDQQDVIKMTATGAPDTTVSSQDPNEQAISEDILAKQKEIDQLLFEQYKDEIAKQNFSVTHTAPQDNHVEIGITPFTEENAEFLYKIVGREQVVIVEGQQATLMDYQTGGDKTAEIYATSVSPETGDDSAVTGSMYIVLLCAAGAVAIGSMVIAIRRRSAASR